MEISSYSEPLDELKHQIKGEQDLIYDKSYRISIDHWESANVSIKHCILELTPIFWQ